MAGEIPKWQERQRLLYGDGGQKTADAAKLSALGTQCLEAGYVQDALEYFIGAKDENGLTKIEDLALEEGDTFLVGALEKAGRIVSAETWNKVGYRAFELGKYRFARVGFEKTENELMLAKIRSTLGEDEVSPDDESSSELA